MSMLLRVNAAQTSQSNLTAPIQTSRPIGLHPVKYFWNDLKIGFRMHYNLQSVCMNALNYVNQTIFMKYVFLSKTCVKYSLTCNDI